MPLYGGIDLHANNKVVVLLDEQDLMVYQQHLSNHLSTILMKWKTTRSGSALVYGSSGCSPRRCSACRCHRRELSERLPIGGRPSVMLNISV
jgi:hypothetical protein